MNDLKVRRWAGAFGLAGFVVFLVALPLYFVGPQPAARLEDTIQFSDSVSRASAFILTRATLADPLIMACLLVFLAGVAIVFRTTDIFAFAYGPPAVLVGLLVISLVTTPLALGLPVYTTLSWRAGYWSWAGRLHYTLVTLAALLLIPFLLYWNLLGLHY